MKTLLEEIQTGARTIAGADHPVRDQLHRTGDREWTITRDICNGTARATEVYRSERTAREAFEMRLDGRKPRSGTASKPITLRVTDAERARWEAVAEREGLSLSEWLRNAADAATIGK